MQPIPLGDAEMTHIYSACRPIAPEKCGGFLQSLANELRDKTIGPGTVYRAIVLLLPKYFDPPDVTGDDDVPGGRAPRVKADDFTSLWNLLNRD
jgi:hypothetical protein